jgi:hypothetical protein
MANNPAAAQQAQYWRRWCSPEPPELITAQQVCMTAHQLTVQAAEAKAMARPL